MISKCIKLFPNGLEDKNADRKEKQRDKKVSIQKKKLPTKGFLFI